MLSRRYVHNSLALPLILCLIPASFHVVRIILGASMDDAIAAGWLMNRQVLSASVKVSMISGPSWARSMPTFMLPWTGPCVMVVTACNVFRTDIRAIQLEARGH